MHLAHISDTHVTAGGTAAARRERELERTIETLNALVPRPLAIVHTGDIVHTGRPSEYEIARRHLDRASLPLVLAVGNRDDRAAMRSAFPELDQRLGDYPFVQYVSDLGPVRLVVVDTMSDQHGLGELCRSRYEGLARLLETAIPPFVVALHHPPVGVPSLHNASQFRDQGAADALVKLLARQPGLIGVLAGHIHREDVAPLGATHLSTAPSIAVDLRKGRFGGRIGASPVCHLHAIGPHGLKTSRIVVELAKAPVAEA